MSHRVALKKWLAKYRYMQTKIKLVLRKKKQKRKNGIINSIIRLVGLVSISAQVIHQQSSFLKKAVKNTGKACSEKRRVLEISS